MNRKIFRSSMAVALCVLLLSMIFTIGILFDCFEKQLKRELESESAYLVHAVENEGAAFFDGFKNREKRATLIAPDGRVLADTWADAESLGNHSDREEVYEARRDGAGESVRYSETLTEKTVYYAVRMQNGNILRVSTTQYTVITVILGLLQPMIVIFIIGAGMALFLSAKVSKSIVKPLNALQLDAPMENDVYEEMTPLLRKIADQKATIAAQLAAAKQKQEEFRLLTENMREGFLVIDAGGHLVSCNSAAGRLLGAETAEGESILHVNRTKEFREMVNKVLSGERAECAMEPEEQAYNLIANPVLEGGKVIGAVLVILDVTESAKREQLRREFTSNVSHELKTPLTSISGFAEMMRAGGMPEETVVDFSTSIYEEAQRLISLVGDIIKISELDERNVSHEWETVDVFDICKGTARRLRPMAEKTGITLRCEGVHAEVRAERGILEEIVYNLMDNAIRYNRENGTVEATTEEKNGQVKIVIRDTGIGIPTACRERVFERFYRVDKSHSKAVGGTGLGLSIVKHGAAFLGAGLSLESVEGEGTCVTISFEKKKG